MFKKASCANLLFVSFLMLFIPSSAFAQPPQIQPGLTWLNSAQTTSGNWPQVTTSEYHSTTAALDAAYLLEPTSSNYTTGLAWLSSQVVSPTDYLSRRIIALKRAGQDVSNEVNSLLSYRNAGGGWGGDAEYQNDIIDTALALQALKATNSSDTTMLGQALGYLLAYQNTDGGWGFYSSGNSNVYMTAIVSVTLQQFPQTTALATAVSRATTYLFAHQNSDGGFGSLSSTVYETALAFEALFGVTTDATTLARTLNYLTSSQSADGSWSQDPYSTALALQALYLSDSRPPVPPPAPTTGTVSGTIVDAATNQHLNDVIVTLTNNPAITTRTDSTGSFSLANVPQGAQQISFSLNGYATSTAIATITAGSIVNIGSIPLSVVSTTGIIQGTVTDASTGGPLSGVEITVAGVTTSTAVTATNGFYKITGIAPENVSITASKSGFLQITGAGTITAGGTLIFSPALGTTPPVATTGGLSGTVIDSRTALPIQGATISVVGAKTYTAVTDMSGKFIKTRP